MSGTTAPPTSTALLEELRQRIRSEYAPPPQTEADRLAAFGRGILSNRGSLLDNLTAGIAAQDQAAEARANRQRLALDMERQVVENAIREQLERDRLAQNQAQFEAEGPTREARIRAYNAQAAQAGRPSYTVIGTTEEGWAVIPDPNSPTGTRVLQGITPVQVAMGTQRVDEARLQRARQAGEQAVRDENARRARATPIALPALTEQEAATFRDQAARRFLATPGEAGAGVPAPPPAPAAVIDLQARPTR
jgi:hypothetical protein